MQVTDFLMCEGGPGLSGGLIDREGYPVEGIDIISIRVMRNRRACLQTDLNTIMAKIEKDLHAFHDFLKVNNLIQEAVKVQKPAKQEVKAPISLEFVKELGIWVGNVLENSPAKEAGFLIGDKITKVDGEVALSIN